MTKDDYLAVAKAIREVKCRAVAEQNIDDRDELFLDSILVPYLAEELAKDRRGFPTDTFIRLTKEPV